jgi:hypothetical protein
MAFVASTVRFNFRNPVRGIRLNLAPTVDAAWTSVPEAAMDKDANAAGWEDEVGPPRQIVGPEAITKADGMKMAAHGELGRRVLAADASHDLATSGWRYLVHELSKFPVWYEA